MMGYSVGIFSEVCSLDLAASPQIHCGEAMPRTFGGTASEEERDACPRGKPLRSAVQQAAKELGRSCLTLGGGAVFPTKSALSHAVYGVGQAARSILARFNGLKLNGFSDNRKDVETPFDELIRLDHALKDVANCRETRKDGVRRLRFGGRAAGSFCGLSNCAIYSICHKCHQLRQLLLAIANSR